MASHLIQVEDSHFNVRALLCVALLCSWNKTKSSSQAIERLVPRFGVHSRSGVMWRLLAQFSGWGISTWMRRLSTWFTAHSRWDFSPRCTIYVTQLVQWALKRGDTARLLSEKPRIKWLIARIKWSFSTSKMRKRHLNSPHSSRSFSLRCANLAVSPYSTRRISPF